MLSLTHFFYELGGFKTTERNVKKAKLIADLIMNDRIGWNGLQIGVLTNKDFDNPESSQSAVLKTLRGLRTQELDDGLHDTWLALL